jgi:glycosyltransferase 2 family protein
VTGGRNLRVGGLLLGIAVTCAFGYFAVRDVDFGLFRESLGRTSYEWLVAALVALAAGVWIRACRWYVLFEPATRPPLRAVTVALLIGYFFNQLLPVRAGEVARVLALHQYSGTSRAEAAGTAVTERIYDVLSLLVLLFVTTPFLPDVDWIHRAAVFAIVFTLLLIGAIGVVVRYRERPLSFLLRPLSWLPGASRERTDAMALNLVHGLAALHRPRLAIPALALTFVSWLVLAVSFWCCLIAFDLGLGYGAGMLVVIAANLALIVPSAPAAVGVFEAAVVVALDPFGVSSSAALAAAVVLHGLHLLLFLVGGVWALNHHAGVVRRRTRVAAGAV